MNSRPLPALMHIPPPLLFVGCYALAECLDALRRLPLAEGSTAKAWAAVGWVMVAGGALLAGAGVVALRRARTTIVPHHTPQVLLSGGPYRFTRNPMYAGLTLAYLGVSLIRNELWPLLLLAGPILILDRVVIPFEEQSLRRAFAESFDAYCKEVGRWC